MGVGLLTHMDHWLLGICIEQDQPKHMITLSQMAYIDSVVAWFKLEDAFKVKMPMDTSVILPKACHQFPRRRKTE